MTARAWRWRGVVPRVRRRLGKGGDHRLQDEESMPYIREAGNEGRTVMLLKRQASLAQPGHQPRLCPLGTGTAMPGGLGCSTGRVRLLAHRPVTALPCSAAPRLAAIGSPHAVCHGACATNRTVQSAR